MATVTLQFDPRDARFPSSNYPVHDEIQGANFPVGVLKFDTGQTCYFFLRAIGYGSGNVTVRVYWYAYTASSGDIVWEGALAAITPNTDSQNIETKAFATASTVTDTHLGTTGKRLHSADISISNLDSIAAGDWVCIKLTRLLAGNTISGFAGVPGIDVLYSDS